MEKFASCHACTAPKRHPGCHGSCPEYAADKARNDECREKARRTSTSEGNANAVIVAGIRRARR